MSEIEAGEPVPEPDEAIAVMPKDGDAETDTDVLKSVPRGFEVDCEDHANWLVRKVVEARNYAHRVQGWALREQRRAEREEQTLLFLFGRQLEMWTRERINELKERRKSINIPAGQIGFRTVQPSLRVDDEQCVIAWAMTHCPSILTTLPKLSRSALVEHFEATGEMPEIGAHLAPGGEKFFIR